MIRTTLKLFDNIYRDGTDIYWFLKVQVMCMIMQFYDGEIPKKSVIISAIPIYRWKVPT